MPTPRGDLLNPDGSINKKASFCTLLGGVLPERSVSFRKLFNRWGKRLVGVGASSAAVNNATGDWYEWLIAICAWNYWSARKKKAYLALRLPNVRQLNVSSLYVSQLGMLITDLIEKVQQNAQVSLITSNPDFVLIDPKGLNLPAQFGVRISDVTPNNLDLIDNAFRTFVGRCTFSQIVGYISVKASLRPDRRLQMAHEGSLVKALYMHLRTRQWMLEAPGVRYYGLAPAVNPSDREALSTVATHSVVTVQTHPERAVDELFEVDSIAQAYRVFSGILLPTAKRRH